LNQLTRTCSPRNFWYDKYARGYIRGSLGTPSTCTLSFTAL